MGEEREEGIVLQTRDYREREKIITMLSEQSGVINLIVKGISSKSYDKNACAQLFCRADYIYRRGRSDLFRYIDATLIEPHHYLRNALSTLKCAGSLGHIILKSQMPGKPSPQLYQLFRSYLQKLKTAHNFEALLTSFYLKLLKHEGIAFLHEAKKRSFSESELSLFNHLADIRSFSEIENLSVSLDLRIKTCDFCHDLLHI